MIPNDQNCRVAQGDMKEKFTPSKPHSFITLNSVKSECQSDHKTIFFEITNAIWFFPFPRDESLMLNREIRTSSFLAASGCPNPLTIVIDCKFWMPTA